MEISRQDYEILRELEERLWVAEFRFDREWMDRVMAEDFFEYGRSGRSYDREQILDTPAQEIPAMIPLPEFKARLISPNVAQVTYISVLTYPDGEERGRRSSIWSRSSEGWILRFHQGTVLP
jgi:hypothetical protein